MTRCDGIDLSLCPDVVRDMMGCPEWCEERVAWRDIARTRLGVTGDTIEAIELSWALQEAARDANPCRSAP